MKKNGYADTTIEATGKRLRHLQKNCNLKEPEEVKGYIANKQCSNAYKESLIETYAILMKSTNQEWEQPFYKRYDKLPKIPTEEKIKRARALPYFKGFFFDLLKRIFPCFVALFLKLGIDCNLLDDFTIWI